MSNNIFQQIKDSITCVKYAQLLGWNIKKPGDRTFSLSKGNNETCLVIYDDWFFDFKTRIGGDVIDLCAEVNHGGDKAEAIKELSKIANIEPDKNYEKWKQYTQNLCNLIQKWHTELRPEDLEYLRNRNINDETIKRLKLGYNKIDNRLIIPYFKNGYVAYYAGRGENPKYKKVVKDGLNENIPWGLHTLDRNNKLLIIAEGAFDAISFDQEQYCVLSPIGGYFSKAQIKQVIDICRGYEEIFLCFDSDDSGKNFTMEMAKTLFNHKLKFSAYQLEGFKDVNDYYVANKNLNFINDRQSGLEFLCNKITDKQEFKQFIKDISRYTAKTTMIELFRLARKNFDKEWLRVLQQQALTCPTDEFISKEILAKNKIRYSSKLGFYEYKDGVWQSKDDNSLKQIISQELGYYTCGAKINSILTTLKAKTDSLILYNQSNIFNFKNGVLELDTGIFRQYNELDNSTIQVNYCYAPNEHSEKWLQFIKDITDNDEQKQNLIQEMIGYILFRDVSLQKCFFLLGEGANGKSVLLNIIASLFGEQNVSTLSMSSFNEPFQLISLYHSLVNINSETTTDVNGAEDKFKAAVVGDTLKACYKGKDYIDFRPKCKFITACNQYIESKDTTDGFNRRIIYIKFPVKFCEFPKYDNEKKMDKLIYNKLLKELPAIFNWVYEGYKVLKQNMSFTETEDQKEVLQEFLEIGNPLIPFLNENEISMAATKEIYNKYKEWCKDTNRKTKNYTNFSRTLASTIKSHFRDKFKYIRSNGFTGYKKLENTENKDLF